MTGYPFRIRHVDAIVIGGGLMGLSSAWSLRQRGLEVMVLEANSFARHASSASAGGVRSLNRDPAEIALARAALPLWRTLSRDLGHSCGFQMSGQLRIAEDDVAVAALLERAGMTRDLGYNHERWINASELFTRQPRLSSHCRGALAVDDDGFADPLATVHAYRQACRSAGVYLLEGITVQMLERDASSLILQCTIKPDKHGVASIDEETHQRYQEYDFVEYRCHYCINSAGAWGANISENVGDAVPLKPVALQMAVTEAIPQFVSAVVGCHGRKLSLKQTTAGAVVIGGGFHGKVRQDPDCGLRGDLDHVLAAQNLSNAVALYPHLIKVRVLRQWAGIEGIVSDNLPVLSPSMCMKGLVHAFGFSAHGFALAPVVGAVVADLVEGRNMNLPIDAFSVDRFIHPSDA